MNLKLKRIAGENQDGKDTSEPKVTGLKLIMENNPNTSTWRVELVEQFNINEAEETTKKAYTTEKEVLTETETKIRRLASKNREELKEARNKIDNGDSLDDTIESLKRKIQKQKG